jgi:hypothetical protein
MAEVSATLLEDPQERETFERQVISRVARLIAGAFSTGGARGGRVVDAQRRHAFLAASLNGEGRADRVTRGGQELLRTLLARKARERSRHVANASPRLKVSAGDCVLIEMTPYELTKGRVFIASSRVLCTGCAKLFSVPE